MISSLCKRSPFFPKFWKKKTGNQYGSFAVEAGLALVPIVLTAGLTLEISKLHTIKNIARLALHEAARSASVNHAHPEIYTSSFKQALLPLYVPKGSYLSAQARQDTHEYRQLQRTGLPVWRIEKCWPSVKTFQDFADPELSRTNRQATIRHDYQMERYQQDLRRGLPGGRGAASGQSIFEANTLKWEMTYLHQPDLPGLQAILKWLGRWRDDQVGQAWRQGLFVIVLTQEVMMQSDLKDWSNISVQQSRIEKEKYQGIFPQRPLNSADKDPIKIPAVSLPASNSENIGNTALTKAKDKDSSGGIGAEVQHTKVPVVLKPLTKRTDETDQGKELCGVLLCCLAD